MGMNRFTLRRELTPYNWKHDAAQQIPFSAVKVNDYFFLTPPGTTRIAFVKVCAWGARVEDSSDDCSWPSQGFLPDTPVYPMPKIVRG